MIARKYDLAIISPMPRSARLTIVNTPHHVFHRALKGRVLFSSDKDYRVYLDMLQIRARQYKVDILAYCLMRDHVNILAVPHTKVGLARSIGRTHFSYTQYLNSRRKKTGPLWRNRFQSCALGDDMVRTVAQYIECQPIYDKRLRKAEKYPWSSASAHISGIDESGVLALDVWPPKRNRKQWSEILAKKLDTDTCVKIATYTQTGRPLGSTQFIDMLEKKYRRRLRPLPVGRPPLEE